MDFTLKFNLLSLFSPTGPTSTARVGDDDPEVDRLLPAQLLKVPLLLDPDGPVGLHRHPRVLVPDLECLVLTFLLQLEDDLALGLAVSLGEVRPLGGAHGACDAAFDTRVHLLCHRLVWTAKK